MILKLKQKPDGRILAREIQRLGGDYSTFEKLRMLGTSSTRVIYISGLASFESECRGIEGEIPFCAFYTI